MKLLLFISHISFIIIVYISCDTTITIIILNISYKVFFNINAFEFHQRSHAVKLRSYEGKKLLNWNNKEVKTHRSEVHQTVRYVIYECDFCGMV